MPARAGPSYPLLPGRRRFELRFDRSPAVRREREAAMPENQHVPENGRIEVFLAHLAVEKSFSGNARAAYRNDLPQFVEFLRGGGTGAAGDDDDPSAVPAPLQVAEGD